MPTYDARDIAELLGYDPLGWGFFSADDVLALIEALHVERAALILIRNTLRGNLRDTLRRLDHPAGRALVRLADSYVGSNELPTPAELQAVADLAGD